MTHLQILMFVTIYQSVLEYSELPERAKHIQCMLTKLGCPDQYYITLFAIYIRPLCDRVSLENEDFGSVYSGNGSHKNYI